MDLSIMHGSAGLALAYGSVQGPLLAGLARGQAAFRHYLASPLVAAPLTAVAGLGMALVTPVLSSMGAAPYGIWQFALGVGVSAALGYRGGRVIANAPTAPDGTQRGTVVREAVRGEDAQRGTSRANVQQVMLGGELIAAADETKHFKLIGTTGTGKSTAIGQILQAALARGDRAVIADPDGGYLRRFYDRGRGDVILNPFHPDSHQWDLFGEIKDSYDIDQLARSLIPDRDGNDRSWREYARTFFRAVTRQVFDHGITDMNELYRLLVVAEPAELRALLRGTPAQPFLDEANSRMFDSIRSVTSSAVAALEPIARQSGERLSIRDWVANDSPGVLFMPYKAGQIAALGSTISAWTRTAIFEAMNRDEPTAPREGAAQPRGGAGQGRLWFVIDELDALGPIDGLKDALARLRKFGGRCVLGFQSIAQVSSTYGQGDAHTIVENCGNTLILRCSASEGGGTARFASQLIGEREVLYTTTSRNRRYGELFSSVTHSEHYGVEPAVMPSQIEQLPDLAGYFKRASSAEWRRVRLDPLEQARATATAASRRHEGQGLE